MFQALTAAALTGLVTGVGAFPFFFVRQLPRRAYDGILGLGAGLMMAAATLGLLREALEGVNRATGLDLGRLGLVVTGFLAGPADPAQSRPRPPAPHCPGSPRRGSA